jgi:rubredoxin
VRKITAEEWEAEGARLYGPDKNKWRFKCPSCGFVATPEDWRAAGATVNQVGFNCVGRHAGSAKEIFDKTGGPCNYTSGGLFNVTPVRVNDGTHEHSIFEFADHVEAPAANIQEGHAVEGERMEAEARQ